MQNDRDTTPTFSYLKICRQHPHEEYLFADPMAVNAARRKPDPGRHLQAGHGELPIVAAGPCLPRGRAEHGRRGLR